VSHSGEYALIGVVREHRIGVDIEQMHRAGDVMGIAERFLAVEEARAIQARDTAAALELFFRIWTRKEACAKGVGDGLGLDFAGFTAGWEGNAGTCLIREPATATSARWSVTSLAIVPGYAAAVALDAPEVISQLRRLAKLEVPA
jgi:4'-phosphopantetheinyl transferase